MLGAVKGLTHLLAKEDGAQDLFLRHKGVALLKACTSDVKYFLHFLTCEYSPQITKLSLNLLKNLLVVKEDFKIEVLEMGIVEECLKHIE